MMTTGGTKEGEKWKKKKKEGMHKGKKIIKCLRNGQHQRKYSALNLIAANMLYVCTVYAWVSNQWSFL